MKKNVRFAIMGLGSIAGVFAQSIARVDGAELYAVGSRFEKKATEFANTYGAKKAFKSYEELVRDPDIDVVYISTPNSCHYECAKLCIKAKKSVLCEKPFMLNRAQAEEIISLAEKNNVFLAEAMWSRYLPITKLLYDTVKSGVIGTLRQGSIDFGFVCDRDESKRFMSASLGGGALLDIGVYAVSFIQSITNAMPCKVKSVAKISTTGVDEHFSASLLYDDGLSFSINCSMMSPAAPTATIYGEKGKIIVPSFNSSNKFLVCVAGEEEKTVYATPDNASFDYEVAETVRCINDGLFQSDIMPWEASLDILEIVDKIRADWDK